MVHLLHEMHSLKGDTLIWAQHQPFNSHRCETDTGWYDCHVAAEHGDWNRRRLELFGWEPAHYFQLVS